VHEGPAGNSRLDELQAAILRVKLAHLDRWNERRRFVAASYDERLSDVDVVLPTASDRGEHVFHQYVIRTPRRDELLAHLRARGVDAAVHYPVPAHRQPPYADAGRRLPVTEACAAQVLSLPIYPELGEAQIAHVTDAIAELA